ncbi:O-methyltransferase [Chengkuizengella axinellae]|uniref:tRNA 5-hydroxyuridine methyltransferase n=1 Tax=Chengkuizengella axinellae TaxID=3064388 RepID=A0ABT9IU07_9BACL|nr:O-methyltransferase [Chengkuizengella sp. 2205SS18-9]MDP5272810.1 O-methyltransferase [Chengkuizengella sp. 2205SS18-9]
MVDLKINDYILKLIPERNEVLQRLEKEAKEDGIPNIQLESIQFIKVLLQSIQPEQILEVGSAIGYSGIHMAQAAPMAHITTLEMDEQRASRAKQNFHEAGVSGRVKLVLGNALETIPALEDTFDFIFIDAAKGQYTKFLELSLEHSKQGTVIVSDNVFFQGNVAKKRDEIQPRYRNMIDKLNKYNQMLANHPELETSFISIGDGLALSIYSPISDANLSRINTP